MRIAITAPVLSALLLVAASGSAQVLVLEPDYDGELVVDDAAAFDRALEEGLERGAAGQIRTLDDTRDLLGDLAACDGDTACILEIGQTVSASAAVRAQIYAEAEIYDFTVRIFDLTTGSILVTQVGDCTFCPIAEAVDAFGFTAEAAITSVDPMPEPTPGPAPEVAEEPIPEPPPVASGDEPAEPVAPVGDLLPGDIIFDVSVVPDIGYVRLNGVPVGTGRARLELGAQSLRVELGAEGFQPYDEEVTLHPTMAGPIFLRVVLTREMSEEIAVAPPEPRPTRPGFDGRAIGGILAAGGTAAAVGGLVMLANDGNTTCDAGPASACPEVWEFTAGGATLTTVGGLALGTGIGMIVNTILGRRNADDPAAATQDPAQARW